MAVRLKKLTCPGCSAPLPLPSANDIAIRCTYCGNSFQIERAKKPANLPVKPQTVYVPTGPSKIVFLFAFLPVLIPLGIAFGPKIASLVKAHTRPFPAVCSVNETLELENVSWTGPGVAVTARSNCHLILRNVTLDADVLVKADSNVSIVFDHVVATAKTALLDLDSNAKFEATDSNLTSLRRGITTESNAEIALVRTNLKSNGQTIHTKSSFKLDADGSRIDGIDSAITCTSSCAIRLDGKSVFASTGSTIESESSFSLDAAECSILGGPVAVHTTSSAKIKLKAGARLKATTYAIEAGSNLDLSAQNAKLESDAVAVFAESASRIVFTGTDVQGKTHAFMLPRAPGSFSVTGGSVSGAQSFDARPTERPAAPPKPGTAASPVAAVTPKAPTAGSRAPFDRNAAARGLDDATARASVSCKSTSDKPQSVIVVTGWLPDGRNANAQVASPALRGTPEGKCIETIFRAVRVPAFDPGTQSGGLNRVVTLK